MELHNARNLISTTALLLIFRSTPPLLSNVRLPIRTSVRPYVHPQKSFFDFNEIWYVGSGRRVMHDGMQYNPIQGQGQGHEPSKVGNSTIFSSPHL